MQGFAARLKGTNEWWGTNGRPTRDYGMGKPEFTWGKKHKIYSKVGFLKCSLENHPKTIAGKDIEIVEFGEVTCYSYVPHERNNYNQITKRGG